MQGMRAAGNPRRRGQQAQKPLPELSDQPACGYRAGRPRFGLRRLYGAGGGLGQKKWGVGDHTPLPPVRTDEFQPHCGGRQSHEIDVHCDETAYILSVSD